MVKNLKNKINWVKMLWVTLWVLMLILTINQGVADYLEGPLPPPEL